MTYRQRHAVLQVAVIILSSIIDQLLFYQKLLPFIVHLIWVAIHVHFLTYWKSRLLISACFTEIYSARQKLMRVDSLGLYQLINYRL